ncbi:hypothetical protein VaNZ11_015444 [Volvox africanus]|uniref:GATA-type domain-containing protein n=1 Tax=Volvox africanus TaxID=51714 RepID=A0ABQ5SL72_9CHLO|nr:hypothetical protein VaNZ11_015444 [Volvox africanus]
MDAQSLCHDLINTGFCSGNGDSAPNVCARRRHEGSVQHGHFEHYYEASGHGLDQGDNDDGLCEWPDRAVDPHVSAAFIGIPADCSDQIGHGTEVSVAWAALSGDTDGIPQPLRLAAAAHVDAPNRDSPVTPGVLPELTLSFQVPLSSGDLVPMALPEAGNVSERTGDPSGNGDDLRLDEETQQEQQLEGGGTEDDSEDDRMQEEGVGPWEKVHDGQQKPQDGNAQAEEEHGDEELRDGKVEAGHETKAEESGKLQVEQLESTCAKALDKDRGKMKRLRRQLSLPVGKEQLLSPSASLRSRLTSCPPPRAAALLAVARIAGHGASQTVAGKAADGVGGGGRDGDIAGGDGVGSGPSGSVKRTRHKSSSATGSPGGNHGTHRAADSKQASSGRQQEQHKHGRDGPAADDSVPRCACGVVYRDRPGQPNGFFARDSRTYTCNSCCLRNKKETGFYGPPGTRSLEEAGGRACEACGTTKTKAWRLRKDTRGAYVCSRCDGHFNRNGSYMSARSIVTSPQSGGHDGDGQQPTEDKHGGMKQSNPSLAENRCSGNLPDDSNAVVKRQAREDQKLEEPLPQEGRRRGRSPKHRLQRLPTQQVQPRPQSLPERLGDQQHNRRGRDARIAMRVQIARRERSASQLQTRRTQAGRAACGSRNGDDTCTRTESLQHHDDVTRTDVPSQAGGCNGNGDDVSGGCGRSDSDGRTTSSPFFQVEDADSVPIAMLLMATSPSAEPAKNWKRRRPSATPQDHGSDGGDEQHACAGHSPVGAGMSMQVLPQQRHPQWTRKQPRAAVTESKAARELRPLLKLSQVVTGMDIALAEWAQKQRMDDEHQHDDQQKQEQEQEQLPAQHPLKSQQLALSPGQQKQQQERPPQQEPLSQGRPRSLRPLPQPQEQQPQAKSRPRCITCDAPCMARPRGRYSGFFARGFQAYTCNKCCLHNMKINGFYGPVGTRSLEEAGGRICRECGLTEHKDFLFHPKCLGHYICNRCYVKVRYGRAAHGMPQKQEQLPKQDEQGGKGEGAHAAQQTEQNVTGDDEGTGLGAPVGADGDVAVAVGCRRRRDDDGAAVVELPKRVQKQRIATQPVSSAPRPIQLPILDRLDTALVAVTKALPLPLQLREGAGERPDPRVVSRWVQQLADKTVALCKACEGLLQEPMHMEGCAARQGETLQAKPPAISPRLLSPQPQQPMQPSEVAVEPTGAVVELDKVDAPTYSTTPAVAATTVQLATHDTAADIARAMAAAVAAVETDAVALVAPYTASPAGPTDMMAMTAPPLQDTMGHAPTSRCAKESLCLTDVIYRWMEVHVWPRPLALMLGPAAAALELDQEGPIPELSEEQQNKWDQSRSELCEGFVDVADAAMGERPREPVKDAGIRRFREVSSHLAEGLAAQLVLDQVAKQSAAAVPADPGAPEPGWPAVIADVITDVSMSDYARALVRGPFRPLLLAVVAEGLRLALRLGMGAGGPGQLVPRTQTENSAIAVPVCDVRRTSAAAAVTVVVPVAAMNAVAAGGAAASPIEHAETFSGAVAAPASGLAATNAASWWANVPGVCWRRRAPGPSDGGMRRVLEDTVVPALLHPACCTARATMLPPQPPPLLLL